MDVFQQGEHSSWIRLSTLVLVRWVAAFGQTIAVIVAALVFDLTLPISAIVAAIGGLVLVNIILSSIYPRNRRLDPLQATGFMLFDVVQLATMLFLTGGLSNPFSMLMLAPVAISATLLPRAGWLWVSAVAIVLVSLMWNAHIPLKTQGDPLVLPVLFRFGNWVAVLIGIAFTSLYARRVMVEVHAMGNALSATQHALAREQKLTDLGGVVAAAAHELGTPLATIALTSSELSYMLKDQPDLAEDADLIRAQVDRCRDILREMGTAGRDDLLIRQGLLHVIVREAAEPHLNRGKTVNITADGDGNEPEIPRAAEIIHGLRNLIQNAVDFAESRVDVLISWDAKQIGVRIRDDGTGFPSGLIERIGDPLLARQTTDPRKGYEGMGLGLFIAKTLLERSGAQLRLANGTGAHKGAIAQVCWPRSVAATTDSRSAFGRNPQNFV